MSDYGFCWRHSLNSTANVWGGLSPLLLLILGKSSAFSFLSHFYELVWLEGNSGKAQSLCYLWRTFPQCFIVSYVLTMCWKGKVLSNWTLVIKTQRGQRGNKSMWQTRNWTGWLLFSAGLALSREYVLIMKENPNGVQQGKNAHSQKTPRKSLP